MAKVGRSASKRRKKATRDKAAALGEVTPKPDIPRQLPKVPVVAIGASAGGLEPFEQFFDAMQQASGFAFVVIQHLSPNFESMMDELLSRHSAMKIQRVVNGMFLEANTIYLNPPRCEMRLSDGRFDIKDSDDDKVLNLPINTFFESVAQEYGAQAIAIVLSGTGSDGTDGSVAIKEVGGCVLVQDPKSAKFEGMPASIIDRHLANAVGLPEEFPGFIEQFRRGLPLTPRVEATVDLDPVQRVFKVLRDRFGTEFSYYKEATILRRLERRAKLRNLAMDDYANLLANDQDEIETLYADLLIEVTSFFRDPSAYNIIRDDVVPALVKKMSAKNPARIWVPGCASGEEAYSLAVMMADEALKQGVSLHLKILATDIHHRSLDAASNGIYPRSSMSGLTDEQLGRYFEKDGDYYQVKPSLRRAVVFSAHNLLKDPPFTRMDLISCRNVLIYFNDVAQQKSLALFHFALAKNGFLFLGPSETTGILSAEFLVLSQKWRIFQKKRDVRLLESTTLLPADPRVKSPFDGASTGDIRPPSVSLVSGRPSGQAHNQALKEVLRCYAPPGFLLTMDGEIVHVFGDAGAYLKVASGLFSKRVVDLMNDDLKAIVSTALNRIKASDKIQFERRVSCDTQDAGPQSVIVSLRAVEEPNDVRSFLLLTLVRVERPEELDQRNDASAALPIAQTSTLMHRINDLESDLNSTEQSLQATIEELETSNEELQATNEELMASNEELQSTNEELHSVNKELYTVSAEHQRKITELTELTDDMNHLLKATEIGTIYLDSNRRVRRYTPAASMTFNLLPQDIGRPIEHLTTKFAAIDLASITNEVIESNTANEQEVQVDDLTFMLRVLPYAASLDESFGAVITTIDISELKAAQEAQIQTAKRYEAMVRDLSESIVRWNRNDGAITFCNEAYAAAVGQSTDELIGTEYIDWVPTNQREDFLRDLDELAPGDTASFEFLDHDKTGQEVITKSELRAIVDTTGATAEYQATGINVTAERQYLRALEALIRIGEQNSNDYEAVLRQIFSIGAQYLALRQAYLATLEDSQAQVTHCYGWAPDDLAIGERIDLRGRPFDLTLSTQDTIAIENTVTAGFSDHEGSHHGKLGAVLATRVFMNNGLNSVLVFSDTRPRTTQFTEQEITFARVLSRTMASVLDQMRLFENLKERRRHYQDLYHQTPVMMCTVDTGGEIVEVNEQWLSALRYGPDDLVGRSLRDFVTPEYQSAVDKLVKAAAPSGISCRKIPLNFATGAGEVIRAELSAIQRENLDGEGEQSLVVIEDVTARNLAYAKIKRQKNELEVANVGLKRFAYVASHDLQEPLRKIRQFGDLLLKDYESSLQDEGKYFLNVMTDAASRISVLVTDLLAYSRSTNTELKLQKVDLQFLYEQIRAEIEPSVKKANAKISIMNLPMVTADKAAMHQLLHNLISNAILYRKPDQPAQLLITSQRRDGETLLHFADKGIGIDAQPKSKVFEPFVRLQHRADYDGSGIGLAICKMVCDRLGWGITYQSKLDQGSIFTVAIPDAASHQ